MKQKSDDGRSRLGRPRVSQRTSDGPVEEEILAVARELFRTQGFSGTSTRQIADAAGLRQPTIFHYFKNKSAILDAIAQRAVAPEIQFLDAEKKANNPPDIALYRYVRFVVLNLHTNPDVIGSPEKFPELTRDAFDEFWTHYDRVKSTLGQLIRKGQREGLFIDVDPKLAGEQLYSLIESPLNSATQGKSATSKANRAADTAATLILRALLIDSRRLDELRETE